VGAGGQAGGRQGGVTAALARFLAASRREDVPAEVRREVPRALLNIVGCIVAGRRERSIQAVEKVFSPQGGLFSRAVLFGAAANALDFDDTHLPTVIHPGPPVAAALFALAGEKSFSGRELLHAYLLGVETACRIGNAVSPGHYQHGWHITSTCGVFGAAAAAAAVLRLNEDQKRAALALAATQSSGLVEMLGSAARALNPGFAARNGIAAALLAQQNIQTPAQPLEGLRGFLKVFGGNGRLSAISDGLGSGWEFMRVAYKPYPAGVVLHALIDACLELRTSKPPEKVAIALHPLAIERGDRPEPRDGVEARLSAQHCATVALLYGAAGVAQFTDAVVADPAVRRLRARVTISADARLDKAAVRLTIDGREKRAELREKMSDAELEAKLRALAGPDAERWMRWVDSLQSTEEVKLPSDWSPRPR